MNIAANRRPWLSLGFLFAGAAAGVTAWANPQRVPALLSENWQTLAVVSAVALTAAAIGLWEHLRSAHAEKRLQEALDEYAKREIEREERRRTLWWARSYSPAVALARAEERRPYQHASR